MGNEWMNKTNVEKDLGVWITQFVTRETYIKSQEIYISAQHENSGRKDIKMQYCVGDLKNQDSQLEEEN